jgi:oligopeptide transport system substrate-binding protein
MKATRLFSAVALLVMFSMVLTACGSDPATNTPAAPTAAATNTTGAAAPAATNTTAAAPAATNTTGTTTGATGGIPGVLRYRLGAEPANIDPQAMSFVDEIGTGELVFEGLMELNEKLEPVPAAAEKMDVSAPR